MMMINPVIIHLGGEKAPTVDFPNPARLLAGNPQRQTWEHYVSPQGAMSAGIWTCEVGKWRIQFAPNRSEFFCVLAGEVCLHGQDGSQVRIVAGEAAVIPAGFIGAFEVVQAVKKYYVVVDEALASSLGC